MVFKGGVDWLLAMVYQVLNQNDEREAIKKPLDTIYSLILIYAFLVWAIEYLPLYQLGSIDKYVILYCF